MRRWRIGGVRPEIGRGSHEAGGNVVLPSLSAERHYIPSDTASSPLWLHVSPCCQIARGTASADARGAQSSATAASAVWHSTSRESAPCSRPRSKATTHDVSVRTWAADFLRARWWHATAPVRHSRTVMPRLPLRSVKNLPTVFVSHVGLAWEETFVLRHPQFGATQVAR